MSETSTTAMLVGTRDMLAAQADAVTATVPRVEVEGALASEPPAELTLEVWRPKEGGQVEKHMVDVAWRREDLESVLADLDADAITFSFDRVALERAIDGAEVEGHGLREAAVVLSIAAAAAVSGASAASAEPGGAVVSQPSQVQVGGHDEATFAERGIESGTVAASHDEATYAARGIDPGTVAASHDEATYAARGIDPGTVAASHDEATYAARGIDPGTVAASHDEASYAARGIDPGTVAASHDEASYAARGIDPGTVAASHDEATYAARGIDPGTVAASHDEATYAARGIEPGYVPASHDEATLVTRGVTQEPVAVSDTGSGFDLPSVDPAVAAGIVGGLAGAALIIAAAGFATRRREPGTA